MTPSFKITLYSEKKIFGKFSGNVYLCKMEISTSIKRRVSNIDDYLTSHLMSYPFYLVSQHREEYLNKISRQISEWYIQTYDRDMLIHADYYKKVNELIPIMKYMFRTKIVLHWEYMNDMKVSEFS
jgi:hypothetical protein